MKSILDLPIKEVQEIPIHIVSKNEFKKVYEYEGECSLPSSPNISAYMISSNAPPEYFTPCIIILNLLYHKSRGFSGTTN